MQKRTSKEFGRFAALTDRLLMVPRADVERRIAQHREEAAKNPRKRGSKPNGPGSSGHGGEFLRRRRSVDGGDQVLLHQAIAEQVERLNVYVGALERTLSSDQKFGLPVFVSLSCRKYCLPWPC